MESVMGMNFSNDLQSTPIAPSTAMAQIAPLVGRAKTFSLSQRSLSFIGQAQHYPGFMLAVGTPNDMLQDFAAGKTTEFLNTIQPYLNNIDLICVGNEPLASWWNGKYNDFLAPAVKNIFSATGKPVTVPQNFEFMATSYPPSAGAIKPELVPIIRSTCEVMEASHAYFMVNIYPYITWTQNPTDIPLDYCLFTAQSDHWVHDGSYTYKNIFDAMFDALVVALGKIGYPNLGITIGECGWPTAGGPEANPSNAQTFLQNLIKHCRSGRGTPRRPNKTINCFVFEAYDEDQKDTAPGAFERHWGVFDMGGKKKFPLDWSAS